MNINDISDCHKQDGYTLTWHNATVGDLTVSDGVDSICLPPGETVVFVARESGWRFYKNGFIWARLCGEC